MKNFFIKLAIVFLIVIGFTIFTVALFNNTDKPLNPYYVETIHNVLFFSCGLFGLITTWNTMTGCVEFKKDLVRCKITGKIHEVPGAYHYFKNTVTSGIITILLYVLQSYIYQYTYYY